MVKIKGIGRAWKAFTATALALILSISSPVLALGSPLTEVRDLIGSGYVDPVGDSVTNSLSIDEMLEKLGDPHTAYFTAQEYRDFLNSMDMTFSGIGVYIDIVPEGVQISSVMPGSPAGEVGIQAADILIEAGGQSLAGLSQETAAGLLRGPEGSTVEITLLRGEERLKLTVARRAIEVPTVTGEVVNGHTGYVAIASFGATTPAGFARSVEELRGKGVDSWIIDLRDNPGGYLSSALSLAGFFIGNQTAVQTKDRTLKMTAYPGVKQDLTLTEPVMFLTNEYSASASEILTAVVKDYQKATILGNRTYGKGSVQSMFPLSDGSVLKMTVAKFFSPLGNEINKVGISPDIQIVQADPQRLAELLLDGTKDGESVSAGSSSENDGKVELLAGGKPWEISLAKARSLEYWPAYSELLRTSKAHGDLRFGSGSGWTAFAEEDWTKVWPMFYPSYRGLNELTEIPLNKRFTVRFTAPIAWESVTSESLELIESESGVRVPLEFEPINERDVLVIPQELLESGKTYWLLTHQGIQGVDGTALREGALAVAHTVSEEGTAKIQSRQGNAALSLRLSGELYGIPDFKPPLPKSDYGQAIIP